MNVFVVCRNVEYRRCILPTGLNKEINDLLLLSEDEMIKCSEDHAAS